MASRPHPLAELTRARILEFLREPEAVFWVFVFPVLLALALGIAFRSSRPAKLQVAVVDGPGAAWVSESVDRTATAIAHRLPEGEALEALRAGRVDLVVEVSGEPSSAQVPRITFRFDPTRPEARTARLAVSEALRRSRGLPDIGEVLEEPVTTPGSRYIDFLIPGLVGLNLMGSGMWGIGFSVVVARTRRLLKRFAATPMRRSHYLLSFAYSRLLFLFAEVAAVIGFGWIAFDVKVVGSLFDLTVVSIAGAVCFAGIGLLVAARPRTIEGVSGWMNLVMLPMWLLSGTFFSYERFPDVTHAAIRALPLTALNDALRAVINQGTGLAASWTQLLVILAWGVASFLFALRIFRWQ